jgi:hypothetical protein
VLLGLVEYKRRADRVALRAERSFDTTYDLMKVEELLSSFGKEK